MMDLILFSKCYLSYWHTLNWLKEYISLPSYPCGIQYTNLTPIATASYLYIITTMNEGRVRCSSPLPHPQSCLAVFC